MLRASKLMSGLRASLLGLALMSGLVTIAGAVDLGVEGQIYEPSEEDFRVALMRLLARHDWSPDIQALQDSARDYTKNLPNYERPRANQTKTRWKDVGVYVKEDIYLPWVDWDSGSVFEPGQVLATPAGTYMNPIAQMPSAGIERLFIFDATDKEQLDTAKALMKENIPQLSFMLIAGDLGPLAEEMNRPVYHPAPTMLEKFYVDAVPSLIGFGKGKHQGHMAITQFKLPLTSQDIKKAWYGLPYEGYDPSKEADVGTSSEPALNPAPNAAPAAPHP